MARRTKPSRNMRLVVAYLRTSKDEQNLGLEAQRAGIEQWCARHGLEVSSWHEEQLSGATPVAQRPALTEALDAMRAANAHALVVLRRCRLGRDPKVIIEIESLATVLDTEAAPDASPDDESEYMRRGMWDLMNAVERKRISRRTREALAALKARGVKLGNYPFGFDHSGQPIATEQAALLRMRTLKAEGQPLRAIAQQLTLDGLPPRGSKWQLSTISRLLQQRCT